MNETKKAKARNCLVAGMLAAMSLVACAADKHTAGEVLDDTLVTTKVKAALVADPVTKAYQISVDTYKGKVKLSGFVDSAEAEQRAIEVARGVEGAADVEDALEVRQ
ncbi:MAG TPA: BON domain-containing protein [Gammaproteobacteria bacterium]|nr:BON domain-containing protein [Gammaproteobacteria bacterium]